MNNAEKSALIKYIYQVIFASKAQGSDITQLKVQTNAGLWPGRWFKNAETGQQSLRGFDFTVNDKGVSRKLRMLEQNPDKLDKFNNLKHFANLARAGHKIAWLIDTDVSNGFIGRIQDDEWVPSRPQVVNPIQEASGLARGLKSETAVTVGNPPPGPPELEDIPDIPDDMEIPEYVLREICDMEPPEDY